ncbi:MAG: HAD family hydrolase [Syntrophaceae bacterium]|nr:HAD family hydrolase [Syntrophaceae bacterium]
MPDSVVFLLDVDNTLLDNDAAQNDYLAEIRRTVSSEASQRYWEIFHEIAEELGYADYLGALECYRLEDMHDPKLLHVSLYLLDYEFEERLYPHAMEVIQYLSARSTVVLLTDGDVVFQPRKILKAGLWDAVAGRVLIYIHKEQELREVERRFPAQHYVMVDDKLRILTAIKQQWGKRVTTVFVKQGHYANDPKILAAYPPADIYLEHIGDLLNYKVDTLLGAVDKKEKSERSAK